MLSKRVMGSSSKKYKEKESRKRRHRSDSEEHEAPKEKRHRHRRHHKDRKREKPARRDECESDGEYLQFLCNRENFRQSAIPLHSSYEV